MGNGRKQTALWLVFVEGAALSLGIYLLLTVLLSALVVKAVLPEEGSFPAVAASCCLASFAGAMLSVRRSSWGSLASAMVSAAGFLLAVVAVALLAALLIGVTSAMYIIFVLAGWLFGLAVYYTVKLM